MRHIAILANQVGQAGPPVPWRGTAAARIVAAGNLAARVFHRLSIDIGRRLVVRRGRDAKAEVGRRPSVVLKGESRAPAFRVFHLATRRDRRGAGGMPVHAVEDHEHDVLLAGIGGGHLEPVDIGLVEVLGFRIERAVGQAAVDRLELVGIAVDAVGATDAVERHAEGIDRNQPVGVGRVRDILLGLVTPVAPPGTTGEFGVRLHSPDSVRGGDVKVVRGGGGGPSADDTGRGRDDLVKPKVVGVAHVRSIPAVCEPAIAHGVRSPARVAQADRWSTTCRDPAFFARKPVS